MKKTAKKLILLAITVLLCIIAVITVTAIEEASVEEATLTTVKGGQTTTYSGNFSDIMDTLNAQESSASDGAVYTIVVNKNLALTDFWEMKNFNKTAVLNIDLNGHNVSSTRGNAIQIRTGYTLNIDGADENGNLATWTSTAGSGSMFYIANNNASSGINNTKAVLTVSNLNIESTTLGSSTSHLITLFRGTSTFNNVHVKYTGKNFPSSTAVTDDWINSFLNVNVATVYLSGCSFKVDCDTDIKFASIYTQSTSAAKVTVNDSSFDTYYGFRSKPSSGATYTVSDSTVNCIGHVFVGGDATFNMTDTEIKTKGEKVADGNGAKLSLKNNDGVSSVTVGGALGITDNITLESGYEFLSQGNGKFTVGINNNKSSVAMTTIFSDGMTLQRSMPINVFGTCKKIGADIKVTLGNDSVTATVGNSGEFKATLPARDAEIGLTLSVEQLGTTDNVVHTFENVSIGEVLVISGQSNAAYTLYKMEDAAEYIANADNYKNIRVYSAPRTFSYRESETGIGTWYDVTSELLQKTGANGGDVSAIAYVLATRMAEELGYDIPIAIIDATYSGSSIFPWFKYETFVENFKDNPDVAAVSAVASGIERYEGYRKFYEENSRYPKSTEEFSLYSKDISHTPGICYNNYLAPIEGYTAKFAVWYQGEANRSNLGSHYHIFFEALKEQYEDVFSNEDLKMFAIQLAPYQNDASNVRARQYDMSLADNVYLISTAREGTMMTAWDISEGYVHSSKKSPVGHRLADSVLKNVYGFYQDIIVEAPEVVSIKANGNQVTVTFDTTLFFSYGNTLTGFELAGADKKFKKASGVISGNTVIISSAEVNEPMYVRYAYGTMDIVLNDGTVITYNTKYDKKTGDPDDGKYNVSVANQPYVVIGADGQTEYVFEADCGLVLETRYNGNITNESGHPMPTFYLEVGFSR